MLLDVLVIGLRAGETEHPLLQDGDRGRSRGRARGRGAARCRETGHAVLAPAVETRAGVIVRRYARVSALAVVLAHRSPLALAGCRPQRYQSPACRSRSRAGQALDSTLCSWHGASSWGSRTWAGPRCGGIVGSASSESGDASPRRRVRSLRRKGEHERGRSIHPPPSQAQDSTRPERAGVVLLALILVAAVANLNLAVANVALRRSARRSTHRRRAST